MLTLDRRSLFALAASLALVGCGDAGTNSPSADGGATDSGSTSPATDTGAAQPPADAGGECPEARTLLDVSRGPGAGAGYPSPTLRGSCTATTFVVESNGIPHYTFVRMTPNPLVATNQRWEIDRNPQVAASTTDIPRLGVVGFAVNGQAFFSANEAQMPAETAWGDPVFNGLTDGCFGHTANVYHYHALNQQCLTADGLVATPWTRPAVSATQPSPVLGWALDGFAVYGRYECSDASCSRVVEMQSGYERTGSPRTNAWDNHRWRDFGDATHLDVCNGHRGPRGDYHYHATAAFPYILGCYRGTPRGAGGGMMMMGPTDGGTMMMPQPDAGAMMGPRTCTTNADCTGACGMGAMGCTCSMSPMGRVCAPTCTRDSDCPMGPMGQLRCNTAQGVCVPGM